MALRRCALVSMCIRFKYFTTFALWTLMMKITCNYNAYRRTVNKASYISHSVVITYLFSPSSSWTRPVWGRGPRRRAHPLRSRLAWLPGTLPRLPRTRWATPLLHRWKVQCYMLLLICHIDTIYIHEINKNNYNWYKI